MVEALLSPPTKLEEEQEDFDPVPQCAVINPDGLQYTDFVSMTPVGDRLYHAHFLVRGRWFIAGVRVRYSALIPSRDLYTGYVLPAEYGDHYDVRVSAG
jgi:hypothetical protein